MLVLKILLIATIILQTIAVVISTRLIRITKYNATWIFFTLAFVCMACQMFGNFAKLCYATSPFPKWLGGWIGMSASIFFTIGLFLVNRLLTKIYKAERKRRLTEQRILNMTMLTEEKERRRFSKDLHDGLGPILSAAKLSVSALKTLKDAESQKRVLANIDNLIDESIKSLKETSNNLNPHILDNFGVDRAVSNFINKIILPQKTSICYSSNIKDLRFSSETEVIVYRAICELVNNALTYADCSLIDVSIELSGKRICVVVKDDGKGFDIKAFQESKSQGTGLHNISSRVESTGGEFLLSSLPNKGTTIEIKIR